MWQGQGAEVIRWQYDDMTRLVDGRGGTGVIMLVAGAGQGL